MKKLLVIALATLMLAGMVYAQTRMDKNPNAQPGRGPNDNPNFKARMMHEGGMMDLELTDAQKTKIEELRHSNQKQMNILQAEIENLEMDIQQAMKQEDFVTARRLTKQLNDKRLNVANARIDHMENMHKQLTAEQREKAKGMFMGMGMGNNMRQGRGMGDCNGDCNSDCMDNMQPRQMHQMRQMKD